MFLFAPGLIVAQINSGELRFVNASPQQCQQLDSFQVADGHTWAPPVLLKDAVLVKDQYHLTMWSMDPMKKYSNR